MFGIVVVGIIALAIALAIANAAAARKRREAFAALAARLGLQYVEGRNAEIPARFGFLNRLAQGHDRYAYNILSGSYRGHAVVAFDYHYATHSHGKHGRQTHHHRFSFFILGLPKACPELRIAGEGVLSKIAQAFGYDDIDFDSREFSSAFCVRSADRRFAGEVCNDALQAYLLANRDLTLELEGTALGLGFGTTLKVEAIESNLDRLVRVRELLPATLFA